VSEWQNWTRDAREWLPEFRAVMEAIGKALQGRQPTPDLLSSLRDEYVYLISGHKITLEGWPKTSRHSSRYELHISGDRLACRWTFTNRQLVDAVNAVCPDFPIRLS
jgi:hypothetical protein